MIERLVYLGILLCMKTSEGFDVIWNVPTEMCLKQGVRDFSEGLPSRLGLVQNKNDSFRGDRMVILYDPGEFPAVLDSTGERNGGLPQQGDLERHLSAFEKDLTQAVPNEGFNGIGVIDFELWRPVWRENWGSLNKYRELSVKLERKKHPFMSKLELEKLAKTNFEKHAVVYFDETLKLAKKLRPKGTWGYYAYPYCYNFTPKNPKKDCAPETRRDNEKSKWLPHSSGLFPSAYLSESTPPSSAKRSQMIEWRAREGVRLASKKPVYVYARYQYTDSLKFLGKDDMTNSLLVPCKAGAAGVVIWGSSNEMKTKKKCEKLADYLTDVIAPILKRLKQCTN